MELNSPYLFTFFVCGWFYYTDTQCQYSTVTHSTLLNLVSRRMYTYLTNNAHITIHSLEQTFSLKSHSQLSLRPERYELLCFQFFCFLCFGTIKKEFHFFLCVPLIKYNFRRLFSARIIQLRTVLSIHRKTL